MALALYRKYRPRTFAEVIGQEHVTEPLSQALRSGRLNHAYLFSGPRGCGKTSSARILARSLNCEQGPTPDPCGECLSCRSLANDGAGSIDVIEIDAASHGGVDDARELREKAFFAPANSRYKIYVIDEAHMVSSAGFNALLKLVEEPPEYVKFIFATTEPDKVLGTIRSRTHHYPFRLIPPAVLRPYLQQLSDAEGVTVEPSVFPLVVRAGGGSARDTLSILDQLIAGSGSEGVTYSRAVALLGVTDVTLIDEMCDALATGDGAAAFATIDRVAEAGHEPRRFASDLLERFRDLIILQQVPDAVAKGLIDGPADQLEAMAGQAARLGAATLSRSADILHNGLVEMRGTTAPRLLLELLTARMLLPGADASSAALLQRLERLEQGVTLPRATSDEVRGGHPPIDSAADVPRGAVGGDVPGDDTPRGASAGGGAKAAAMAAARAASSRPGPAVVRPVSPAPAAAGPAAAASAAVGATADGSTAAGPATPAQTAAGPAATGPAGADSAAADPAGVGSAAGQAGGGLAAAGPTAPGPAGAGSAAAGADTYGRAVPSQAGGAPTAASSDGGLATASSSAGSAGAAPSSVGGAGRSGPSSRAAASADGSEPDWNGVADGPSTDDGYDEEPPWDDEPSVPAPRVSEFDRVRTVWEQLTQNNQRVSTAQSHGVALGRVDGQAVVITAPTAGLVARMRNLNELLAEEFSKALGGRWQVRCEVGEPPPSGPSRGSAGNSRSGAASPAHTPTPDRNASPERNTGRSEPRPSRPAQRGPSADGDDDWPAAARPPSPGDQPQTPPDRAQASSGRSTAPHPPAGDTDWPEPARPPASDRGVPSAGAPGVGDDGWPEPARPPASDRGPASSGSAADGGWPEPARPPATDRHDSSAGGPAAGDGGRHQPVPPPPSDRGSASGGAPGAGDGGWPEPARPPAAGRDASSSGAPGAGDGGWPEPARPPASEASGSAQVARGDDWPEPARPGAAASGVSGSSDWPEPVRPGNPAADGSAGSSAAASGPASGAGGPGASVGAGPQAGLAGARAVAGGSPPAGGPAARPASGSVGGGSALGGAAVSAAPAAPARPVPARSAAMEAARAAARTGKDPSGGGAAAARAALASTRGAAATRPAAGGSSWSDGSPTEEAPYDPEYDGPPSAASGLAGPSSAASGFDGFDPGDEPLDDVIDEKTARQSSEEQAMQLLRAAFGAEKIGEL